MRIGDERQPGTDPDVPCEELAGIVLRADSLGFSRWGVATALGISAIGLAAIERRNAMLAAPDGRAQIGLGHPSP